MRISGWSSDVCSSDLDAVDPGDAIVVEASRRLPGAVIGDIPPDQQLGPADIRAYGVSSIDDLLTELGPQTQSASGGRPIVLLNGRRIADFRELRDLPTAAILRVAILPAEVALKYGHSAQAEARRVGRECGSTCRSRVSPEH